MAFRFSEESPDESMFKEISMFNAFSDEQFQTLMAHCLKFLCGNSTGALFMEDVASFCKDNGVNPRALRNSLRSYLIFFKGSLKANLTPKQVGEDLAHFGLNEEKASMTGQLWKANFLALSRATSDVTLMVNQLVDMQWKFGVTSSNSELFKAGSTFLQMKLVLDKGDKKEAVNMELSLPQFYEFVHEMEKAKSSLELFHGAG